MSKSSNIAIWIALALPLLTAPLWADGIINGGSSIVSGSTSVSGTGCTTAGAIIFSSGSLVQCGPALTNSSGNIILPAGQIVTAPTNGWACIGGNAASSAANAAACFRTTQSLFGVNGVVGWGSLADPSGSVDVGLSRSGVASITVGNGSAANASGGMNMALLSTTATVTHQNLVTGTNADFLCLAATGVILIQTTACTISSLRFKPDWKPYAGNALTKVSGMEVGTFHTNIPNNDPNWQTEQAGLNAENIAKIAPECAVYENDMKTPKSYRQECVIALLVRGMQDLQKQLHDK